MKVSIIYIYFFIIKHFVDKKSASLLQEDFFAWCRWKSCEPSLMTFAKMFSDNREFRSIVYYRLKRRYRRLIEPFFHGQTYLYINGGDSTYGGGLP